MKRVALLGSTALFGAGMMANTAMAADGIKLGVGGFFRTAYMVNFDDDSEGEPGNERNTDGVFCDAEIHFNGSTVLDNGLEVGARVELEGEDDDGDQIDEAWIYFSGGFGEVRMGSTDDALTGACILPPGGTTNFSAFSPNQWGANTDGAADFPALSSNAACVGVDDREDAQKLVYISPSFGGFQLNLWYTPNGGDERHGDGVGAHIGMPINERRGIAPQLLGLWHLLRTKASGWGLSAGAGGSFEGHVEQSPRPRPRRAAVLPGRPQPHLRQLRGRRHVRILQQPGRRSIRATMSMPGWRAAASPIPSMPGPSARNTRTSSPRSTAAATTTSPWTARC